MSAQSNSILYLFSRELMLAQSKAEQRGQMIGILLAGVVIFLGGYFLLRRQQKSEKSSRKNTNKKTK